jgi:hypothetical protein
VDRKNMAGRCAVFRETKDKSPPNIFEAFAVEKKVETGEVLCVNPVARAFSVITMSLNMNKKTLIKLFRL